MMQWNQRRGIFLIVLIILIINMVHAAILCPSGCTCISSAEAQKMGYSLCGGNKIICDYDLQKTPLYCYQKPTTTVIPFPPCSSGCGCLYPADAKA
ncbi:MAG: hypothetical protein LUO93_08665, partial [Methanomicrobiales archaeon]|nr:hypothetical protein [Methanomicrobiales archaeon]